MTEHVHALVVSLSEPWRRIWRGPEPYCFASDLQRFLEGSNLPPNRGKSDGR